jgi:hypothetical protein
MLALSMLGKLDRFTTFSRRLSRRRIVMTHESSGTTFYARENLELALEKRRFDLVAPLVGNLCLAGARELLAGPASFVRRTLRRDRGAGVT